MSDHEELEAAIEAILFASPEPVSRQRLEQVFKKRQVPAVGEALERVIERLRTDAEARGILVEEVAGGLRLVTRPELHGYLRSYFDVSGQNRLSMAALETLAIVAYRQPITGPEIQELRGVNSSGVLKTLLDRRLIRIAGRKQVVGKPFVYRTTREFLMHFGLAGIADLPPLEEFEESFGALEAQEPAVEEGPGATALEGGGEARDDAGATDGEWTDDGPEQGEAVVEDPHSPA